MKQVYTFFSVLLVATLALGSSGFCVPIPEASPDTFGKTDVGSSSKTIFESWKKIASRFEASGSGNITEVSWYGKVSRNSTCYAFVYANNASDYPSDLLGISDPLALNTTVQWWNFSFSTEVAMTQNTKYWLGVLFHAFAPTYYYDTGGSHKWVEKTDLKPPDDPFGEPDSIQDREMSIYATYRPSDTVPPTVSILSPENETYSVNTVPLTFTVDELFSWIGYSLDGQANVTITGNTTLPVLSDGTHHVVVYANDTAGNTGASSPVYFTVDTTSPTGSITIAEGAAYMSSTSVTLTLFAEDATSGVAQMRFSNDNATWTSWEAYYTSKAWTLIQGDGAKTVYVQFMDNAGLISQSYQNTIILDTTKPAANAGFNQTVLQGTTVTFDGSGSGDNIGIAGYRWVFTDVSLQTLIGVNPSYTFNNTGNFQVTLNVSDYAGNTATDTISIAVLLDTDEDGTPNITDSDDDNDGVKDDEDAFPLDPTEWVDTDGDGIGNNVDTDDDNDGIADVEDALPLDVSEYLDTDGDGLGNNADTDDDNDRMPDSWETENELDPFDASDASLDPDGDGFTNLQEYQEGTDPNVSDAETLQTEAFPLWVVGVVAVVLIGIAVAVTLLWKRGK